MNKSQAVIEARKKSEEELRLNSEIVKNMAEGVFLISLEDSIIRYTNSKFEGMFGYNPGEMLGKHVSIVTAPTDKDPVETTKEILDIIYKTGEWQGEIESIKKDGTHFWCYTSVSVIDTIKYGKVLVAVHTDITERKKADEKIKRSERKYKDLFTEAQRFRYALDKVSSYVHIKDLQSRYNYGNQLTLELFNRSAEELVGCDDTQFFSPDTVKRLREIDLRVFNGETTNEEIENIDENGVCHYYLEVKSPIFAEQNSKKIVGLIGISTDITERKQAEENLRASEKKYSTLVEKGNDGIIIIQDNIFKFANSIMYEMTGFAKEEVIGKPFLDFVVPEFRQIVGERYEKRMKGHNIPNRYEIEIISKGGKNISIEINATQIEYEGKPADMAMIRDMTYYKKLEKLVIENQSLALSDKTKSDFLSVMSHELRTPLNASIGFSELLKMGKAGELNKKQGKFVDNILNSSKHLLDLIEAILDFSKIESGKMELNIEQVLLYELIDDTLNLMEVMASERNVILKSEVDPKLNFIECDARMLKQVLYNLLDNAIKFSKDEGGSVTVTAVKDGEIVIISVSDTGIGIKDVNGDRLFSFFKQLDTGYTRKYKGTGLGLAITKQLVELQGGRIWVESKCGEGSTFTVILPIVHSIPESSEAQE